MDPAESRLQVRDALAYLHDLPFQKRHPLTVLLSNPQSPDAGGALREVLLDAIHQFRPGDAVPMGASVWRCYRLLTLRYVDGKDARQVADELAISDRRERRGHHAALEALVTLLRQRAHISASPSVRTATTHEPASTDIAATIQGVIEWLRPLLAERGVTIAIAAPPQLARTSLVTVALR